MPQGRHRGEAVRRPLPTEAMRRLPRDLRLSVASAGVAGTLLGATTVVATLWPGADSGAATQALTVAARQHDKGPVADALQAGATSRLEERTSRRRSTSTAPGAGQALPGTALVGSGPGRAPASTGARSLATGISGAPCPISATIQSHLTANADAVYRAVCAEFGHTVSSFGGYRAGSPGDHGTGRAVDIMVSGDPGLAIAHWVQAHAVQLHVTYVIYQQKIWLAGHPLSAWTPMADRGSRTANHYDHVHVSVS